MPYQIEVPGKAVVSFPDSVSHEEAQGILAKQFPPTGEDIATQMAKDPSFTPTKDQFVLFKDFKDQQSTDYIDGFIKAIPQVAEDIGKGIPGMARAFLSADKSLAATGVEAFSQGTRNLYGMLAESESPSSPLFKFKSLLTGDGSVDDQYKQFLEARDFSKKTQELESGNNTLIAKPGEIDPDAVKALSYVLDPTLLFGPVKGLAAAGHLGEAGLRAAEALGRVEAVAGKAGLKAAEAAGTGSQAVGETIGKTGATIGRVVDDVAGMTGIPAPQARTVLGAALGAGLLGSHDVVAGLAATAVAGGVLNRGGEVLSEAAKIAQQGPSRLGVLERVAMSPNVSAEAKKLAGVLAQASPVIGFAGDVAKGAAEGTAIGSALGYLSTGTAEGAGAGGGSGAALGTIGGTIGSMINMPAKSQEGALADITRFASGIPDEQTRTRLIDGLSRIAGEDKNWRRAAATIDAVTSAQERGIEVKFGAPDSPAAFFDPKSNSINLNPDKFNSESAVHELDHALRAGAIGKAYSEGLREVILGVKDQNGNTLKPGITDLNGLADVADKIAEQYKTNPEQEALFKQFAETLKSGVPEADKAEAIGSVIDELTSIYTGKLFARKGMEDALTKRLPLFYRNLVDSVTQRIYDKFRTTLYERGTAIPVGNSIKYAFTDDQGRLIRIPELDALIEKSIKSREISASGGIKQDVPLPSDMEMSPLRFEKLAGGDYKLRPKKDIEDFGKQFNKEALERVAAVSKPGDPVMKEVSVGVGKGLSLRDLNETQIQALINTDKLPDYSKKQIYNDWKNLRDPSKGTIQDTVNYRVYEEKHGGSKTILQPKAQMTRDDRLVHDIVLTPKRGILQRGVNATRVKDALARLIHEDRYKGLYHTPGEAVVDLHKYLNNLTLGEGKAIPSAQLFGGGVRGEKTRNLFHEAVGFPGEHPDRPAGYDISTVREKGVKAGQGIKHEDLNYYHIRSSTPTGERWSFNNEATYKLGKVNFQPEDFTNQKFGDSNVSDHKLGYRIIERDGRFSAYGKNGEKLGVFRDFNSANNALIDQSNKEYATRQRLLAKDYVQEHQNRNDVGKASEAGNRNRLQNAEGSLHEIGKEVRPLR
jgi:hypothetical protein